MVFFWFDAAPRAPRYAPEYNPIEMAFGWIKRRLIQIGPIPDHMLVCDRPKCLLLVAHSTGVAYFPAPSRFGATLHASRMLRR